MTATLIPESITTKELAEEYAKLKAIRFQYWRSKISVDMSKRHLLSLPLDEQYDLFIKENNS